MLGSLIGINPWNVLSSFDKLLPEARKQQAKSSQRMKNVRNLQQSPSSVQKPAHNHYRGSLWDPVEAEGATQALSFGDLFLFPKQSLSWSVLELLGADLQKTPCRPEILQTGSEEEHRDDDEVFKPIRQGPAVGRGAF